MITFKILTIKNFMSFGNKETSIDLSKKGLRLILGENRDTEDGIGTSNGSGKSSINQALIYALFGRGLDRMKSDEMINIVNGKKLVVELSFDHKGAEYKIIRGRKPNRLEFYKGKESLTLDSMANTDALIQQIVGLDFDVFITSFYLSPYKDSFLAMSPADQRSLFEIILSLDVLTERAETLKLIRKDLEVDVKIFERDLQNAEDNNKKLDAYIVQMENKKQEVLNKRSEIQEYLNELEAFDIEGFKDLLDDYKTTESNLKTLKEEDLSAVRVDLASIPDLSSVINNKKRELDAAQKVLQLYETFDEKMSQEIKELKTKLDENFKKPEEYEQLIIEHEEHCKLKTELESTITEYDTNEETLVATEQKLEKTKSELEKFQSNECPTCGQDYCCDHAQLNEKLNEIKQLDEQLDQLNFNLLRIEETAQTLAHTLNETKIQLNIESIKKEYQEYQLLRDKLESTVEKAKDNPYESQIKDLNIDKLNSELDELKEQHQQNEQTRNELQKTESELKATIDSTESELEELHNTIESTGFYSIKEIEHDKKKFTEQLNDLTIDEYDSYIESYQKDRIDADVVQQNVKETNDKIDHCKYLIRLLTDSKGFIRKNIVSQYVPFINKKILEYTGDLGLNHVISINEDLTSSINIMNSDVGYWNLSQGERLRVNLAVTIAFRELLKMLGKSTNLIIVDEMLDAGADASMVYRALRFLDKHVDSGLLVSHKNEVLDHIEDRIKVVKENGFSRVV